MSNQDNKYFNVFVGPPWNGSNINSWPGLSTNNDGTTISNYFSNPPSTIDSPNFPPQTPGGWSISGGGRKRKTKKNRKSKKDRKSKKGKKYKKSKKYKNFRK